MNDTIIIALIAATPPTVVAIGGFIMSYLNRKKLSKMEIHIDGRLSELLKASAESERAKGVAEGRVLGVAERADRVAESERVEDRQRQKAKD